ncbi:MAG: hypothetical protein PSX79_06800 [bacterium]|nr:hypothetical protein [bacterium]
MAEGIDRRQRHYEMTLEGMADVDAGRFIDQAAIEAWADNLDKDSPAWPRVDAPSMDRRPTST